MTYSSLIRNVFGDRAQDGPLFSFWTHFPHCDRDAECLAEATVETQRTFDLDFVKTAPNGMYAVEDYGVCVDYSEVPKGGIAKITATPFAQPSDWARLPELDPARGTFARELRSLRMVREALPDLPIFFTVFSPMTTAAKLSQGRIRDQIRAGTETVLVHQALARIARSTRALIEAALASGATGIFFAHQDTSRRLYGYDDFSEYVMPYDIEALMGAAHAPFNILHLHGESIRFYELLGYPVQAMHWHDWETLPSASAGLIASKKCMIGGLDRWAITRNEIDVLKQQVRTCLDNTEGLGDVILAPSCTVRAGFDARTVHRLRDFVRGIAAAPSHATARPKIESQAALSA
ncbi:uroporphyrinogen decarboxylase family protein [Consotaella aegiceratis]|uniref:uroporphyrinogen decarboxylase family protein n=1 Tax=Consotaella aegiceratis TaxID=3097961 RepID=UPI002F407C39